MTHQELENGLKRGMLPPLLCLYGEETFLVERAVRQVVDRGVDPSLKDFNFNVFYGGECRGIEIVDAAQILPMFTDRRVVLVKRADQLKAEALEILLPYVLKPCESTCLVFTGTKIDQRKKFFMELKKQGALVEYKRLYDNKLSGFIQSEATALGKPIEPAGADLLAVLIGNSLQELSSQLEKLVIYAGSRQRITVDDVRSIASNSKAYTSFELARFMGIKDLQGALKSLEALFLNGEEIPPMLGALSRHFRQLWRVRELQDRRVSQSDIGREAGISPFFLTEYLQQAQNFKVSELQSIFGALLRCDISSKSGGDPATLMSGLVFGVCTGIHQGVPFSR